MSNIKKSIFFLSAFIFLSVLVFWVSTRSISQPNTQPPKPTEVPILPPLPNPKPPTPTPTPRPVPAPAPVPKNGEIIIKVGEQEGSFLVQKINSDSVEGLWRDAIPIPMPCALGVSVCGNPQTIRIGDNIGYACMGVSEKLTSIDFSGQKIVFNKIVGKPPMGGCPICLSGKTLIDTPSGSVLVKDLQVGMPVWTTDKTGRRVSGIVIKTSKVSVPPTHQMVHLVLDDGRELFVSPGHPTIDGDVVGNLIPNDFYDGARVVSSNRVTYDDSNTFDILPSGDTGFYWANGILVGSTLHN